MKRTAGLILVSSLIFLATLTTIFAMVPEARPNMDLQSAGGIVLVAGNVVDLKWDPGQYPDPNGEPFLRWELYRGTPGNYSRIAFGGQEDEPFHRDQGLPLNTTFYYYLDVVRQQGAGEVSYRVFGSVSTTTGRVAGTVHKDLSLAPGDYAVTNTVIVTNSIKLVIPTNTTLRAPTTNPPTVMRVDGGTLQIDGSTIRNHLLIQYGDPNNPTPGGAGFIKNTTFDSESPGGYTPLIEIRGGGQHFDLLGNTGLAVTVYGKNTLSLNDSKGTNKASFHDETLVVLKKNNQIDVELHNNSSATLDDNIEASVDLYDESTADVKNNSYVNVLFAYDQSKVSINNNQQVRWIVIQDQAEASILNNTQINDGIDVYGSARAIIRDNTIANGGIWVSGYGAPNPNKKAYADITGNIVTSPYKNQGIQVYDGAEAKVREGNLIEWSGYHGENESSILLAAAGEGTQLTASGNSLKHGKLLIYDRANVSFTDNVLEGGGAAVTIGCVVCNGDVEGLIEHNTLQNGWGFEVWDPSPRLVIRHNCIRGNDPGLMTDDYFMSQNVDVRWNWWGDASGPYHPTNPGGKGDKIEGSKVTFNPWDPSGPYCRDVPPPPHPPDVSIAGMEVVQVVQDLNNTVPLVAGKNTVVRVYLISNTYVPGVSAKLEVYRGDQLISILQPKPETVSAFWHTNLDEVREKASLSLNFNLDPSLLTAGAYTFKAEIDPASLPGDRDYNNNSMSKTVSFRDRRTLNILYIPIRFLSPGAGVRVAPSVAEIQVANTKIENMYPHAKIKPKIGFGFNWDTRMRYPGDASSEIAAARKLLSILNHRYGFYNKYVSPQEPFDQVVGVFASTAQFNLPFCISDPLWYEAMLWGELKYYSGNGRVSYCFPDGIIFAHEIGHNLGLFHANTPDAGLPTIEDTYWDDHYQNATIQEYGYDFIKAKTPGAEPVINKNDYYDLMSYQGSRWLSPLHYKMLFDANGVPQKTEFSPLSNQVYLMASGTVHTSGSVEFQPFWQMTTAATPMNPPQGTDYCLELRGNDDSKLASQCFNLGFYNHEAWSETDSDNFMVMLPLDENTTRVVLTQGNTELGQVQVSPHPPTVTLLSPNGGEGLTNSAVASWTASDDDGDPLAYTLLYSHDDGASWMPIAENITDTTTFEFDLDLIPGSDNGRLRVEVSDGFHTANDMSDGVFSVPDHAPLVGIATPEDGATYAFQVGLWGTVYDVEDGELEGEALVWSSDVEGELGTGDILLLDGLIEGEHVITLSAADSMGQVGSDSVTITIKIERVYLPSIKR